MQNFYDTYVLFDSETAYWAEKDPVTGLLNPKRRTPHLQQSRLFQYSINGGPVVVLDLWTEEGRKGLDVLRLLADGEALLVGHNLMYDLPFLKKQGIEFKRVFDTEIASQILNAGIPMEHNLAALMDRYLGKRPYDEIGRPRIEAEAAVMRERFGDYEKAFDQWIKDRDAEEARLWAEWAEEDAKETPSEDAKSQILESMKQWCAANPVSLPCPDNYMTAAQINQWVEQQLHSMKRELQASDWSLDPLTPEQLLYAATDVGPEFNELYLYLRDRIAAEGFQKVFDLDMQVVPIVAEMSDNGIKHNLYKWWEFIEAKQKELATIEDKIFRTCDAAMQRLFPDKFMITLRRKKPNPGKPAKVLKDGTIKTPEIPAQTVGDLMAVQPKPELRSPFEYLPHLFDLENGDYRIGGIVRQELGLDPGETFNINSAVQMRKLIDAMLGQEWDPKHNFDDKAVEDLKKFATEHGNQEVVDLLTMHQEAQGLRKLTQTYGESYWSYADPGGYIHGSFTLAATDTARMSSREPNLQNLPRFMQKMLWSCEEDEVIVKADYSAQEARLLMYLGKQWDVYQKLLEGLDIHCMSASFMLNKPYDELVVKVPGKKDKVKPEYEEARTRAKVVSFAPAYNAGPKRLGEALGADYKAGKKFYDNYWRTYDKVKVMQDKQIASAIEFGMVSDLSFGRMRWFQPSGDDLARLAAGESRQEVLGKWGAPATNYANQCTGGTILRVALLKVHHWIKRNPHTGAKLRLAVHDSLILTCKPAFKEEVSGALAELMEAAAREVVPGISIPVDVDIIEDHTAPFLFSPEGYEKWKEEEQNNALDGAL